MATSAHMPAEWRPHDAVWLAWPSHPAEWPGTLAAARREHAALCAAIADVDPASGRARGEQIELLVLPGESEASARAALAGTPVRFRPVPFGDVWLRDTAPCFLTGDGLVAACFAWNGWGGRYLFAHDPELGGRLAELASARIERHALVLEGGAIEVDGDGTVLTTRQCLANPNRNPGRSPAELERSVLGALGHERLLWLERGLANDHTDGHIDTLVRFVAPGRVVCMTPSGPADPNREVLEEIRRDLAGLRDARGRRLEVDTVPSPGRIENAAGELVAASYVNYYVGNTVVVVPSYGVAQDDEAVARLGPLFPGRRVVPSPARAIVSGGGAFHCITQQQPRP